MTLHRVLGPVEVVSSCWLFPSCLFTCAVDAGATFCLSSLGSALVNEAQIGSLVPSII